MKQWRDLLQEHLLIRGLLDQLEVFNIEQDDLDLERLSRTLSNLDALWNAHEIKEERFLDKLNNEGVWIPNEKTIIEEHREIRGHWRVLQESLRNKEIIGTWTALDTDGKMLIEKLRTHMAKEEISINRALINSNPLSQTQNSFSVNKSND